MKRVMDKKDRILIDERGAKAKKAAEVVETLAELLKARQENRRVHGLVSELSRQVGRSTEAHQSKERRGKDRAIEDEESALTNDGVLSSAAALQVKDEALRHSPTPVFTRPDAPINVKRPTPHAAVDLIDLLEQRTSSRSLLEEILHIADILMDPSPVQDPAALEMVTKPIKALALAYYMVEEDDGVIERAEEELELRRQDPAEERMGSGSLGGGKARADASRVGGEVTVSELKERLTREEALSTRETDAKPEMFTKNAPAVPRGVGSPSTSKSPASRFSFPLLGAAAAFSFGFKAAAGSGTGA